MGKLEEIGFYTLSDQRAATTSPTSQMQRCEIIINEYCNFRCAYCRGLATRVFENRIRKELTLAEVKQAIDFWCEGQPLKNIRFSGGEPTLHKDLVEMVKYAKMKGISRIALSTNGSNTLELYQKLVDAGANDFSVSLDSANKTDGDALAGNIEGAWERVVQAIRYLSSRTYVTVGAVLSPDNIDEFLDIVEFASSLGVSDIRVISSAQWNRPLEEFLGIPGSILSKHPILRYRLSNFVDGKDMRGIKDSDTNRCPLVMDDSVIAGEEHYPCVIYMREQGTPIGKVGPNMRAERVEWAKNHDTHSDPICRVNCLDVCIDYNNRACSFGALEV